MLRDAVVVDAVVHPYNLGAANRRADRMEQLLAVHRFHQLTTGRHHAEYLLDENEFLVDFDGEALTHALFAESPVDLAIIHSLPNLGFTSGRVTEPERMAALRDRYPGRYLLYATVDIPVADTAADELERQVKEYGVDGLKLYPVMFYDDNARGWRLDDDRATPLLEAAQDLGIRNIAIHKAIPVPPAPAELFRLDDFEAALDRFPQINFHMVHAGVAFVEETAGLMARHSNLYANLESSFSYLLTKPRRFAESIGPLLAVGGAERLLFGSGVNLTHPRPLLEAFDSFEMPADLVEDRGFPSLTEGDRAKILGGNALRMHGLTATDVRTGIVADRFEELKRTGFQPPWSLVRRTAG